MSDVTKDPKDTTLESTGCCCGCGADKPAADARELTDEQMAGADGGALIYDGGATFLSADQPTFLSTDGPTFLGEGVKGATFLSTGEPTFLSTDGAGKEQRII